MGTKRRATAGEQPQPTLKTAELKRISAICSLCGHVFAVAKQLNEAESWQCPNCDPSAPPPSANASASRPSWVGRLRAATSRIRLESSWVQLLGIVVAFLLFLVGIQYYLSHHPAAEYVGDKSAAELEAMARGVDLQVPQPLAALNGTDRAPTTGARGLPGNPAANAPGNGPYVEGALTLAEFAQIAPRLFGKEIHLPCRLVEIRNDAEGLLPNNYKLNGETIHVPETEASRFVRLVVADSNDEQFGNVFVERERSGRPAMEWIRPGDWFVVHGTAGMRFDRQSQSTVWGLVVTKLSGLDRTPREAPVPDVGAVPVVPTAAQLVPRIPADN